MHTSRWDRRGMCYDQWWYEIKKNVLSETNELLSDAYKKCGLKLNTEKTIISINYRGGRSLSMNLKFHSHGKTKN